MLYLVVHFESESFKIPAEFIAEKRAAAFCEDDPELSWIGEVEYALADEGELIEWAQTEMDWLEVEAVAESYWSDVERYDAQWPSAEMEVIEI